MVSVVRYLLCNFGNSEIMGGFVQLNNGRNSVASVILTYDSEGCKLI